jgi:hypothetical protein
MIGNTGKSVMDQESAQRSKEPLFRASNRLIAGMSRVCRCHAQTYEHNPSHTIAVCAFRDILAAESAIGTI